MFVESSRHFKQLDHDVAESSSTSNARIIEWGLKELVKLQNSFAETVLHSKEKDDRRGPRILEGYELAHPAANVSDPVVAACSENAHRLATDVEAYLSILLQKIDKNEFTISKMEPRVTKILQTGHVASTDKAKLKKINKRGSKL